MNQKALIAIAAVLILVIAGIGAFAVMNDDKGNDSGDDTTPEDNTKPEDKVLEDFAGQPVVPVENLDRGIVAVGQDSLRWMTMFGLADKCVMVDWNDAFNFMGKSYMYSGRAQIDIANSNTATPTGDAAKYFSHTNGSLTSEDMKTIIDLDPSIVVVPVSLYQGEAKNIMGGLEKAGINTVAIDNLYTFLKQGTFEMTDDLVKIIDVLSAALGQADRGNELKAAFNDSVKDIRAYASKITETKTGYIGSVAYNGAHGVTSSMAYYLPMELAGVRNILAGDADYKDSGVLVYGADDISKKLQKDTIIFLDASGYGKNYGSKADQTDIGVLKLFAGHDAHLLMPYIWTGINFDSVFVDALMVMHYAYGDSVITQEQMDAEIQKIYERFYGSAESTRNVDNPNKKPVELPAEGTTILEDMNKVYETIKGHPVFGDVEISAEGGLTLLR